jgi:PAS domain S-box-containing protein
MTKKTYQPFNMMSQRMTQNSEIWERIFEAVPDLIMILDTQHKIMRVNKAMAERLGKAPEDLVGSMCYEIVHGTKNPPAFCPHASLISDGKEHSTETHEDRLDGDFLITVSPIFDSDRKIIGSVHVARDITKLKQLERQLKKAHDELERKVELRTKELVMTNEQLLIEIEARKRVEKSLTEAEFRYRTIADFTNDWEYWINVDGSLLYVSPSCERITGYKVEDFIKDPTLLKKIIVKEDQALWIKEHSATKINKPHELRFRIRAKSGEQRWIEHLCQPVTDETGNFLGYRASNRDITHRKRIEEELQMKKQSLAEAQRIAHLGNWDWNIVTNELYWSDEIYRIFGLTPQEFGATYEAFLNSVHPDDRPLVEHSVDAALHEDKAYSIDHRIVLPDGSERIVHEQAEVIRDDAGQAIQMSGTVQDITERKKTEDDRRRLREELTHVSRITTIGTLSGAMAHEINQPLTAIMSNAQSALRFLDGEKLNLQELRETLTDIVDDTTRSSDIIHQLRDLMKKGDVEAVPLKIDETIKEVINLTHRDAEERKIAVRLDMCQDLPEVMGDKVQFQQVILNLVINGFDAMMYQDPNSRELVIRVEQDDKNCIHVAVKDTGMGIEEQKLEQIFEPFVSTKPEGMGLGLSINRYIIDAHNGHMWATNNLDHGATVHFTLPIKKTN